MGPVHNPDRPQGRQNLLEAFANFKRRNQWISLKVSNEIVYSLQGYPSKKALKHCTGQ